MRFTEQQIVRLKRNIHSTKLLEGDEGIILAVRNSEPPAYEVEFMDRNGKSIALLTLAEDDLVPKGMVEIYSDENAIALYPNSIDIFHPSIECGVDIHIDNFHGIGRTWFAKNDLETFVQNLESLREDRIKKATLVSMNPGEFLLSFEPFVIKSSPIAWTVNILFGQFNASVRISLEGQFYTTQSIEDLIAAFQKLYKFV
jgi:hypothetical protein